MGCSGSKRTRELAVEGGTAGAGSRASGGLATSDGVGKEASISERSRRSIVGHMMQSHVGPDTRRLDDEYDGNESRVLGSGMSGQVATVRHRRTGATYALKTLNIHQMGVDGLDELRREIDAMRRLDHPNIVKLYEIYEDFDSIHMILELCTGGELVARIMEMPNGIQERDAARHITVMLSALSHCHEHNVVHRDIKLDNFVYEEATEGAELKLIDFGLSHLSSGESRGLRPHTLTPSPSPPSLRAPQASLATSSLGVASARSLTWRPRRSSASPTPSRATCGRSVSSRTCCSRAAAPSTLEIARKRSSSYSRG